MWVTFFLFISSLLLFFLGMRMQLRKIVHLCACVENININTNLSIDFKKVKSKLIMCVCVRRAFEHCIWFVDASKQLYICETKIATKQNRIKRNEEKKRKHSVKNTNTHRQLAKITDTENTLNCNCNEWGKQWFWINLWATCNCISACACLRIAHIHSHVCARFINTKICACIPMNCLR